MPIRDRKKLFTAFRPTEDEKKLRAVQKELKEMRALIENLQQNAVASSKRKTSKKVKTSEEEE